MKDRVTFLNHPGQDFDPAQLQLQNYSLRLKSLKAARHDRLTLGLDELPQEVHIQFQSLRAFHPRHLLILTAMASPKAVP